MVADELLTARPARRLALPFKPALDPGARTNRYVKRHRQQYTSRRQSAGGSLSRRWRAAKPELVEHPLHRSELSGVGDRVIG